MAISTVNIGSAPNDGTGDPLRTAFDKLNTNFLNITADGGDEINVTDPTTSTGATLNDALANIYASGGDTPDLQAVTGVGNTITDGTDTNTVSAGSLVITDGATSAYYGREFIEITDGTNAITIDPTGVTVNGSQYLEDKITVAGIDYSLPTGASSQIATTGDIPTLDATPTDGSTNGVESNGVFDALALKADKATTRQIIRSKNNGTFGSHTGNTSETVLFTIPISGGEFEIGDWMDFIFQFERLVTGTNITVRLRSGTNGNTSDSLISTLVLTSATLESAIKRERFEFNTGNILKGASSTFSSSQSDIALIGAARTSTSLNPANNWILTVTASLGNSGDTISCTGYQIGKTKTF